MPPVPAQDEGRDPLTGVHFWHPVIKIDVEVGGQRTPLDALVDSGADYTSVSRDVAESLFGIDFRSLPRLVDVAGLTGQVIEQRKCDGTISWRGIPFCSWFAVVDTKLPRSVVGQTDFFKVFKVDFSEWSNARPVVHIDPHPPKKRHPKQKA